MTYGTDLSWTDLPALSALRAFAAYAQTGSVQRAGAALNVSHAAISQQIRNLEAQLGLTLLDRRGRQARLTQEGDQLAEALQEGFGRITQTVADLTGKEAERPLQITTTPSFAAGWLMPRLSTWRAAYPEIDLMIDANPGLRDPSAGGIDVAIRYGQGPWPGLTHEMLLPTGVRVVAAPELLAGRDLDDPSTFADLPWLRELGTSEASMWLTNAALPVCINGPMMELPGNLMLDALRSGQGVGVVAEAWVAEDIAAGRLQVLHGEMDHQGYHIVTRPGVARTTAQGLSALAPQPDRSRPKIDSDAEEPSLDTVSPRARGSANGPKTNIGDIEFDLGQSSGNRARPKQVL